MDIALITAGSHGDVVPFVALAQRLTAAGLRAGVPTVICPFYGDQTFWGARVADIGAGPAPVPQGKLSSDRLAAAIDAAAHDPAMRARARAIGEELRAEDGTGAAVEVIEAAVRA